MGCGIGDMLRFRPNTIGVDINEMAVKQCRSLNLEAQIMKVDKLPFQDQSFDSVILDNVLEHIDDPRKILKEIYRVLIPGGVLLVGVPCERGFESDSDHKVFYDESKLCSCLSDINFSKKKVVQMPLPVPKLGYFLKSCCLYGIFEKK